MPCLGFICRTCKETFSLYSIIEAGDGLDHFERAHGDSGGPLHRDFVYTAALFTKMTNDSPRRNGSHYTASMGGGCHREHALKRTVDYWEDPHRVYAMLEGTLLHEALRLRKPWEREVEMPETPLLGGAITVSGVIDRLNRQSGIVQDLKSHNAPSWTWKYPLPEERAAGAKPFKKIDKKVYPPGESEQIQVNLLCRLVEAQEPGRVYSGEIVNITKGGQDTHLANRLVPVPRWADDVLLDRLLPNYTLFKQIMSEPSPLKRLVLIGQMELEGRNMYNSRDGTNKCDRYCSVRKECDGLLPEAQRL